MGRIYVQRIANWLIAIVLVVSAVAVVPAGKAEAATYTGTVFDLEGDDVISSGKVPIGFNFSFYGTTYTDAWVSTNGSMQFGPTTTNSTGTGVPSGIDNVISPFWDDLYTNGYNAKSIYYTTLGSPGSRKFILQWSNMNFCCSDNSIFGNIQIVLYEGSNTIRFQYFDLVNDPSAMGGGAAIGIEKDNSTNNWYGDHTPILDTPTDAIEFTPNGSGGYTDNGHQVAYDPMVLQVDPGIAAPVLNAPADVATDVSPNATLLSWKAVEGATSYIVAVADDPDMMNVDESSDGNVQSYVFSGSDSTTYYWRVSAFKDGQYSYSPIRSFSTDTTAANNPPDMPTSFGPSGMVSGGTVNPVQLLSTPFSFDLNDADSGDQVGYEFIIATSPDPEDAVIDYMSTLGAQGTRKFNYGHMSGGTYLRGSNSTPLVDGTTYFVMARAYDVHGDGSDLSDGSLTTFDYDATPTDDGDNTATATEDGAPNSGDANGDGFPDSWEDNVSSFVNPVTGAYTVLQVDGLNPGDCHNTAASVAAETAQANQDGTYSYPAGLMSFTVTCATPGATAKITQYFYGSYPGATTVRKYNSNTHTYSVISGAQVGSTTIGGLPVVKAEYFVTDGGALDEDGAANGTIVDPSGPAVLAASAPNTGLQPTSLLPFGASLSVGAVLLAGTFVERRRRSQK